MGRPSIYPAEFRQGANPTIGLSTKAGQVQTAGPTNGAPSGGLGSPMKISGGMS